MCLEYLSQHKRTEQFTLYGNEVVPPTFEFAEISVPDITHALSVPQHLIRDVTHVRTKFLSMIE